MRARNEACCEGWVKSRRDRYPPQARHSR